MHPALLEFARERGRERVWQSATGTPYAEAAIDALNRAYEVVDAEYGEGWEFDSRADEAVRIWHDAALEHFEASAFLAEEIETARRAGEILDEALMDPDFRLRWVARFPGFPASDASSLSESRLLDTSICRTFSVAPGVREGAVGEAVVGVVDWSVPRGNSAILPRESWGAFSAAWIEAGFTSGCPRGTRPLSSSETEEQVVVWEDPVVIPAESERIQFGGFDCFVGRGMRPEAPVCLEALAVGPFHPNSIRSVGCAVQAADVLLGALIENYRSRAAQAGLSVASFEVESSCASAYEAAQACLGERPAGARFDADSALGCHIGLWRVYTRGSPDCRGRMAEVRRSVAELAFDRALTSAEIAQVNADNPPPCFRGTAWPSAFGVPSSDVSTM
jgi:hypothetical protein